MIDASFKEQAVPTERRGLILLCDCRWYLTDGCDNYGTKYTWFYVSPVAGRRLAKVTQVEPATERIVGHLYDKVQFVTTQRSVVLWKLVQVVTNHDQEYRDLGPVSI